MMQSFSQLDSEDRKLYFLFVTADEFPPFRVDVATLFGGELAGRGHRMDWLMPSATECKSSYETVWAGGRVWVGATDRGVTSISRIRKYILGLVNDFRLFKLSSRNNYDFIQVKDKFIAALMAIVAAKINKTKFVYWLSFPFAEQPKYRVEAGLSKFPFIDRVRGRIFQFLLYRLILPNATHVFVQSEQMKEDVEAKGISPDKLSAVPMGVSIKKIGQVTANDERESKQDEAKIVYLGYLNRARRIEFLIRAFVNVVSEVPNATLFLIGGASDEEDIDYLKNEVKRLDLEANVVFTGHLPMEKAWELVSLADIGVSPLYPSPIFRPASPTKVIEYMALGKPVVVNEHPEQQRLVEQSGGGLCVPYNEADFSNAILKLIKNSELASEMGARGKKYIELTRTYKCIADEVENKYIDVIFTPTESDSHSKERT